MILATVEKFASYPEAADSFLVFEELCILTKLSKRTYLK